MRSPREESPPAGGLSQALSANLANDAPTPTAASVAAGFAPLPTVNPATGCRFGQREIQTRSTGRPEPVRPDGLSLRVSGTEQSPRFRGLDRSAVSGCWRDCFCPFRPTSAEPGGCAGDAPGVTWLIVFLTELAPRCRGELACGAARRGRCGGCVGENAEVLCRALMRAWWSWRQYTGGPDLSRTCPLGWPPFVVWV
jgi:hypothetical protein